MPEKTVINGRPGAAAVAVPAPSTPLQPPPVTPKSTESIFTQIENDPRLTARERIIQTRKEMRKRYEMIREASDIKRDETFKPYRAQKIRGRPHPDPVIESIALSSVPVPDVTVKSELPRNVTDEGKLSDLQLEAVIYSKQVHNGPLKGDVNTA